MSGPGSERDIDYEGEGLLDDCHGDALTERVELLDAVFADGASLDAVKRALASDRLPMLASERALAGEARYSLRDLAERSGAPLDVLLDVRRAMGFARPDAGERMFSEEDLEWAAIVARLLSAGFAAERLLDVMRVLGHGLARGARSIREALAETILQAGVSESEVALRSVQAAQRLLPLAGPLLQQMLRWHLLEQVRQEQNTMAELRSASRLPGSRHVTVAFADIVGFTGLGERLPVEEVERVAAHLEHLAADLVEPPVHLVKTIGDAVMLVSFETGPLIDTALALVERAAAPAAPQLPPLRVGLACGTAVNHSGDWYGPPVNLASRVTTAAPAGAVVCTPEVRGETGDSYTWAPLGSRRFKGIEADVPILRVVGRPRREERRED